MVLLPENTPFSLRFWFLAAPAFAGFLVPNLGFHSKRPLSLPLGRGCCTVRKKSPLLQPSECIPDKTCHYSQIENVLRFGRLFEAAWASSLMTLGHYGSENVIISPVRASGTTWAPILQRSLPDGRDLSPNDLIFLTFLHILSYLGFLVTFYYPMHQTLHYQPLYGIACPVPQ